MERTIQKKSILRRTLAWFVLFTVPALLMLQLEYFAMGEIGHQTPDAVLYLSIADNYVKTGHFIQTARDITGMVVPPGTPFMLTIFRLLGFSNRMILNMHILMFGIANILLYETEFTINGRGIWAPMIYTAANLRCWIILGDAIVEHYYLLLMCIGMRVLYSQLSEQKKIIWMNLIGLFMMLVRPLLAVVYLTILVISIRWCLKKRNLKIATGIILPALVILSLNVAVNYRETGEFVLLDNYSASDVYVGTRSDAPIMIEDSRYYQDKTYRRIAEDESLTMQERSRIFKKLARENIRDHPGLYLKNAFLRGHEIFLKAYAWTTLYMLTGGFLLARKEKETGTMRGTAILLLTVLLSVLSSFGVSEVRYSIVIWPMASIHGAYITNLLLDMLKIRIQQGKTVKLD